VREHNTSEAGRETAAVPVDVRKRTSTRGLTDWFTQARQREQVNVSSAALTREGENLVQKTALMRHGWIVCMGCGWGSALKVYWGEERQ
jgi:RNase adaptor protein for sRNA GlmZ degradation